MIADAVNRDVRGTEQSKAVSAEPSNRLMEG